MPTGLEAQGGANLSADAAAVQAALSGRQEGYRILMDRHREAVFRYARGHVGDDQDALDITQDSFISAFAALHRYDPERPFRGWILRIAINRCRDWARRRKVRRMLLFARPIEDANEVSDPSPDPEAALSSAIGVARVRSALAELPPSLKDPLMLCNLEGMSQDEAAQVLGISRKAVETRIYRARQRLSEALQEPS